MRRIVFRIIKYLNYKILSGHKQGHGIHSPFVFDLVTRVFRNKTDHDIVSSIERIRKRLLSDHNYILVNDMGIGSESFKTNYRKVSYLAKYSAVPEKYGVLLSNMAMEFGSPLIVEFGTSFGISTMFMALSSTGTSVITIEGSPSVAEIAIRNFKEQGLVNIDTRIGSFEDKMTEIVDKGITPGLVFIDGNHRKEPVIDYFSRMAEISDNNTVIIIDDINYSEEMGEAWNEIKENEKVSLTIDIYRMGIVFFREGINHRNYIIRY